MLVSRPWRFAATIAIAASLSSLALHAQRRDDRNQSKDPNKLTEAQRMELAPLVRTVDEVMKSGTPGTFAVTVGKEGAPQIQADPAAVPLAWRNDFLKASNNLIFVPFTVTIEPGKMGTSVAGYLRVAPKGSTGAPPPPAAGGEKKDPKKAEEAPLYPFEDSYVVDLRAPAAGQAPRLTRAFAVPAGTYDVYLALRERATGGQGSANSPLKVAVLKQELTVPNYWNNELTTSSLIMADKVEPLNSTLSPEAQRERPYVLGTTEIVPSGDNKFKKSEELGVIFQVYGYQMGSDKKPDVTIDYMFHQKDASGGEKPFNKTEPQKFNAQTLPPTFDPEQGHQIVGGQMIPLVSFPEGDFRLEIKVTDNKATKSITREVLFSVVPAS